MTYPSKSYVSVIGSKLVSATSSQYKVTFWSPGTAVTFGFSGGLAN